MEKEDTPLVEEKPEVEAEIKEEPTACEPEQQSSVIRRHITTSGTIEEENVDDIKVEEAPRENPIKTSESNEGSPAQEANEVKPQIEEVQYEEQVEEVYEQQHFNGDQIVTSDAYTVQEYQVQDQQTVQFSASVEIPNQGTVQISSIPYEQPEDAKAVEYTNLESVPSSQYSQQYEAGGVGTQYLQHQQYQHQYEGFSLAKGAEGRGPEDSPPNVMYNSDPSLSSAVRMYPVSTLVKTVLG